jgi:hypothetical protein
MSSHRRGAHRLDEPRGRPRPPVTSRSFLETPRPLQHIDTLLSLHHTAISVSHLEAVDAYALHLGPHLEVEGLQLAEFGVVHRRVDGGHVIIRGRGNLVIKHFAIDYDFPQVIDLDLLLHVRDDKRPCISCCGRQLTLN